VAFLFRLFSWGLKQKKAPCAVAGAGLPFPPLIFLRRTLANHFPVFSSSGDSTRSNQRLPHNGRAPGLSDVLVKEIVIRKSSFLFSSGRVLQYFSVSALCRTALPSVGVPFFSRLRFLLDWKCVPAFVPPERFYQGLKKSIDSPVPPLSLPPFRPSLTFQQGKLFCPNSLFPSLSFSLLVMSSNRCRFMGFLCRVIDYLQLQSQIFNVFFFPIAPLSPQ